MRHSCSLGLTYRAARDVTDGHVWHCTNKQPVDSAANTHTLNPTRMWKHTAHRHILSGPLLWEPCTDNNPLQTLSPTYFMFTFVTLDFYVVSMSLFIPLKTCIFERQTCVYVDKNVLCHCQSRAATTGRFTNWMTDRKLVANYWWFESR